MGEVLGLPYNEVRDWELEIQPLEQSLIYSQLSIPYQSYSCNDRL